LANTNKFPGLDDGPITHSAVDNLIADGPIGMGDVVQLVTTAFKPGENIPRVISAITTGTPLSYGIAVGGDEDGDYGNGSDADAQTLAFQATSRAGQGVKVVSRGNCLARVAGTGGAVAIADKLTVNIDGRLRKASTGNDVIAIALNTVAVTDIDMIPVEVVKEGKVI